jgi:WD40 repeat protein
VYNTSLFSRSKKKSRFIGNLVRTLLAVPFLTVSLASQQNCPLPPAIQPLPRELNIFSAQQEIDLGDAMAESLAHRIKIIDDDKLNAYLRALGDRLVQHLPPTQLRFRFYLVELSEVNAFSIAGGRVYVARKMVALTKSDDELAGVLAHELGHIVTHQTAIQMSARLREVLGVKQVGDRADVFDKFHLLLENEARKPGHGGGDEEKQYVADQVALYAMARAGYAPHAYIDLWDRFQQTHGKTGSWISNLFGTTKPSERRLGEMLKNLSALPSGCADIPPDSRTAEFASWQGEVIDYSGFGTKESLPGLVFKQTLARPLRPDITNLRFSPDGKYVLAQDEGGIHVLTRDPFLVLFYIAAVDAHNAVFTPDSRSIVFHNRSLRVESWSVIDQRRTSVHELTLLHRCIQSELSPDGSALGCLTSQFELSLIDVASGSVLASKKSFAQLNAMTSCTVAISLANGSDPRLVEMKFSPDGHYFVAGTSVTHFAWDLNAHRELSLPGSIKDIVKASFAFLGPDRIIGIEVSAPTKSAILRFPSGERVRQIALVNGIELVSTTHGDHIFVGPLKDQPMGLYDLKTGRIPIKFKRTAADIYDGVFVTEQITGELVLNDVERVLDNVDPLAKVKLPQGRLGALRAAAVSADFNWIAISHRTRGAIWDVAHNIRTMETRSFHGAWFAQDQSAYIDFPKFPETEREIARVDPLSGTATLGYKIGDAFASQYGPYLVVTKSRTGRTNGTINLPPEYFCLQVLLQHFLSVGSPGENDEDVELRDVRDGHLVWSHYFPHEVPALSLGSGKVLLKWSLRNNAGRDELGKYPELKNGTDLNDYLLEEIDLQKDSVVGKLVLKTNKGSFAVTRAFSQGDWVIASATGNQVLTYSMASGQEKGHFFGTDPSASRNGLLAVENESGQLSIYEMASSQLKQQYTFSDPISFKTFSPSGDRLFVVTASQTAYILDLTAKN